MTQPFTSWAMDEGLALQPPVAADGSALSIRLLDPNHDIPAVCQLFTDVFGPPMPEARWRWKYMQAPRSSHYNVLAVHSESGQILGHMGVSILPGVRGGQPVRMAHATDLMISPLARAGIGPDSVYRHIMHGIRVHAMDAGPAAPPLFMYGFPGRRPATLAIRLGIQRRLQICTQYTPPAREPGLRDWWNHRSPWRLRAQALPATEAAWSDEVLNAIWRRHLQERTRRDNQAPDTMRPTVVKDAAYLRWRYLQHPQQFASGAQEPLYTLWLIGRSHCAPQGWVITRQHPETIVVDSCLLGDADTVLAALQALPPPAQGTWASWLAHPRAQAKETLSWATAMQGKQFYEDWLGPVFQPGDTDVY